MAIASAAVAPPVFEGVTVRVVVTPTADSLGYTYQFNVTNPGGNTLELFSLRLDISSTAGAVRVTAFGPTAWYISSLTADHQAMWGSLADGVQFMPGMSLSELGLTTAAPPCVRLMTVKPDVFPYIESLSEDPEIGEPDIPEQVEIQERYILKIKTLGPLGVRVGTFEHWNTFESDLAQTAELGWITDAALLASLKSSLQAARQAVLARNGPQAIAHLQAMVGAIEGSNESQRSSEGYALVKFNAESLRDHLPIPGEAKLTLAPAAATHPLAEQATVTATFTDLSRQTPIPGLVVRIEVVSGPHRGVGRGATTDAQGQVTLTYTGRRVGEDQLQACELTPGVAPDAATVRAQAPATGGCSNLVTVTWEGGPDLAVPFFIPPLLLSRGGNDFVVHDTTENLGTLPAGESVTRYFVATAPITDWREAQVVGERPVPALEPAAHSEVANLPFRLPAGLPEGRLYLAACADAENQVIETDETNNCSYRPVEGRVNLVTPVQPVENQPPDCIAATATPALLWPPNHKLVTIDLGGISDPDGDAVTLTVTGITQDEPTNGLGDGDKAPDGFGVATATPQVRAERSGTGNGRVYALTFTAEDGNGGSCTATVTVGVPHDRHDEAVDDGQNFDSTK